MSVGPNPRINPDGFYVNGAPLPASYWATLDLVQYQGVRGDVGGTWAPAAPIEIGGAGTAFYGAVAMANSGAAVIASTGNPINLGDSDFIEFTTPLTRAYIVSIGAMGMDWSYGSLPTAPVSAPSPPGPYVPQFVYDVDADGLTDSPSNTCYVAGGRLVVPLDLHQGATLSSVILCFLVSSGHTANPNPPASLPQLGIFKVDNLGNVTPLSTNAAQPGWVGGGFVQYSVIPASGTAWYDGGALQLIPVDADAGTVVDNSTYRYFAVVIDEQGASSLGGNVYTALEIFLGGIADTRPQ